MRNFYFLLFLLLTFHLSLSAMEKSSLNAEDFLKKDNPFDDGSLNPIDAELLVEVTKELLSSGESNLYDVAQALCERRIAAIEDTLKKLAKLDFKNATQKHIQAVFILLEEFIVIPNEISELQNLIEVKNPQHLKAKNKYINEINQTIDGVRDSILADRTAWMVLKNSINKLKEEPQFNREKIHLLFREILRMLATSGKNFYQHDHKIFWEQNIEHAKLAIAVLLIQNDIAEIPTDLNLPLINCLRNLGKRNWYWSYFLRLMDSKDADSPFYFTEKDRSFFSGQEEYIDAPPELNLKSTELFKILDLEERKKISVANRPILDNYYIYDGDIYEYIKQQTELKIKGNQSQRDQAYRELLQDSKNKTIKNHSRGNKNKKPNNNKSNNKNKNKNTHKKNTRQSHILPITNHNMLGHQTTSPLSEFISPEEEKTFISSKKPAKEKILPIFPSPELLIWGENIRHGEKKTNDKYFSSYENFLDHALKNRVHFFEYRRHLAIFESTTTKYQYNEILMDAKGNLENLKKQSVEAKKFIKSDDTEQMNLLKYFITFYGKNSEGNLFSKTYFGKDLYSSSGNPSDVYVRAHDCLTKEDKIKFQYTSPLLSNLCSKNMMAYHCKHLVADGFWLLNAHHTEASFSSQLSDKDLPGYLANLLSSIGESITIDSIVIGVYSRYDLCYRCQWLLQGLQWNLRHILNDHIVKNNLTNSINIHPNFSTMIIAGTTDTIEHHQERNQKNLSEINLNEDILPTLGQADYTDSRHQMILFKM